VAEFDLARRQRRLYRLAPHMQVRPRLAPGRNPQHRAGRLAIDKDDPLVPGAHLRDIALDDYRLAIQRRKQFQQRRQVLVARRDVEDAGAAIAEQRLDDVFVLLAERDDLLPVGGDQRRRHDAFEMRDEQLLRCVAHARGIVHHQGLRMDVLEQVGGGDISHVEWRILAHQDHVHSRQVHDRRVAELEMPTPLALHPQRPDPGIEPAALENQVLRQVMEQTVSPLLRLEREREGTVGVDVDRLDRIHLDGDGKAHRGYVPSHAGWATAVIARRTGRPQSRAPS